MALGVTMFLPEEDRYSMSKLSILSQISALFGGRIAEELTLGSDGITTGASNDIERATKMARAMVTKWGLTESLGPLMYDEEDEQVFLGMSAGSKRLHVSGETARKIDEEVRTIIDECYGDAQNLLEKNREKLDAMAAALLEYETIDRAQIDDIMAGREPRPPEGWNDNDDHSATGSSLGEDSKPRPAGPVGDPAADH
jgi:cell division protease FtsH